MVDTWESRLCPLRCLHGKGQQPGLKEQEEAGKTSTDGSGEPAKALRRDAREGRQGEHAVLFCSHTQTHTLIHTLTHTHTPASFPSPESGKRYIIFF